MKKKKENYENVGGVWRTIGGRRVFIKKGQSLSDAMRESGKFKKTSDVKREEYQKTIKKSEVETAKENQKHFKTQKELSKTKRDRKDFAEREYSAKQWENEAQEYLNVYDNPKAYTGDMTNEVWAGKHVEGGPNSYKEKAENEAEKYYSKLSQYQAREDLDMRKSWLDDNVYAPDKRKEYEDFYKQGEEYYQKKYNSVEERYNKDKDFRDSLKKEHQKTLDATRKEIQSYLDDEDLVNENLGINGKDEFYDYMNNNYWNVSKKDFDKIYKEEEERIYERAVAKGRKAGLSEDVIFDASTSDGQVGKYEKYIDDQIEQLNGRYERAIEKGRKAGLSEDTIFDNSIAGNSISKYEKYIDDQIKGKKENDISPMSEWSDTMGTGFSDLQSTTLKNRYKGTYEYLKNTKNMSGSDILELLKKIDEDKK